MRSLLIVGAVFGWIPLTVACGDEPPIYPPLPNVGADTSTGDTGSGAGSSGAPGKGGSSGKGGNGSSQGGKGNSNGGSQGNGGSGATTGNYCEDWWGGEAPPAPSVDCDLGALSDGGDLTGDITTDKSLESGKFYTLKGVTRVMPGKTLTIPPCVEVRGQNPNAVLVVLSGALGNPATACSFPSGEPGPGGKLMAVGEPMAPIIFTSSKEKGQRAPGDWGGLLLLGNARNNVANENTRDTIEGLENTECHGWYTDKFNGESSGALEYVRVEYASRQTSLNEETNNLTLASIGSGTSIHHVMSANSNDDCFEWFGGTVNADHLIALNCDDDMFDSDRGFAGKVQFTFGRQYPVTVEHDSSGFEIDSSQHVPHTTGQWSNFTMCGGGPDDVTGAGDPRVGLVMRTASESALSNGLITGFAHGGIKLLQGGGTTTLSHSTVFATELLYAPGHDGGTDWFTKQEGNSADDPIGFCDCWAASPVPIARDRIDGVAPTGFAEESADYQGAFEDSTPASNWMKGLWVDWSEN